MNQEETKMRASRIGTARIVYTKRTIKEVQRYVDGFMPLVARRLDILYNQEKLPQKLDSFDLSDLSGLEEALRNAVIGAVLDLKSQRAGL